MYTQEGLQKYNTCMAVGQCGYFYRLLSDRAERHYKTIRGSARFCIACQDWIIASFSGDYDRAALARLMKRCGNDVQLKMMVTQWFDRMASCKSLVDMAERAAAYKSSARSGQ